MVIEIHATDVTRNAQFVTPIFGLHVNERLYLRRSGSMSADHCQACALSPKRGGAASEWHEILL